MYVNWIFGQTKFIGMDFAIYNAMCADKKNVLDFTDLTAAYVGGEIYLKKV